MTLTPKATFCVHLAATLAMTGIIWFIHVVHYPLFEHILFEHIPAAAFRVYEAAHTRLTVLVVVPLMVIEAMTGVLLFWRRPAGIPLPLVWVGVGLLGIIWLSTAFLQVPQHSVLAQGFDPSAQHVLVTSNWIRTVAWSARTLLVVGMLLRVMPP